MRRLAYCQDKVLPAFGFEPHCRGRMIPGVKGIINNIRPTFTQLTLVRELLIYCTCHNKSDLESDTTVICIILLG